MSISELTAEMEAKDSQVATLSADLKAASDKQSELQNANTELTAKLDISNGQVSELSAKLEAAETAKANAEAAKLAAEKERDETKLEAAKAREQGARFGAPAPKTGTENQKEEAPVISRQDFVKLTPAEQREFIQAKRGKVQD